MQLGPLDNFDILQIFLRNVSKDAKMSIENLGDLRFDEIGLFTILSA